MPEDIELNSLRRLIKHQLSNPKSLNATKLINSGIDNANNISLKKKIKEKFKIYKYLLNKKNLGFTKAANQAIRLGTSSHIADYLKLVALPVNQFHGSIHLMIGPICLMLGM